MANKNASINASIIYKKNIFSLFPRILCFCEKQRKVFDGEQMLDVSLCATSLVIHVCLISIGNLSHKW